VGAKGIDVEVVAVTQPMSWDFAAFRTGDE
jgi:hypothetical protein